MPPVSPTATSGARTVLGVCNLCEAICGLQLSVEDGPSGPHVTGVRGNPDEPLSRGHLCPKGVALPDVHADPDRLRRPVRRVSRGGVSTGSTGDTDEDVWEEIGWEAVAVFLGNPTCTRWAR